MKKRGKSIAIAILMVAVVAIQTQAATPKTLIYADECMPRVSQLYERIKACEDLLLTADSLLIDQELANQRMQDIMLKMRGVMDEQQEELDRPPAWYNNPWYMSGLGFIAGGLALSWVQK